MLPCAGILAHELVYIPKTVNIYDDIDESVVIDQNRYTLFQGKN